VVIGEDEVSTNLHRLVADLDEAFAKLEVAGLKVVTSQVGPREPIEMFLAAQGACFEKIRRCLEEIEKQITPR